jgi:hypothetical protein
VRQGAHRFDGLRQRVYTGDTMIKNSPEWNDLQKRFADFGSTTAKETLSAAADFLKVLSKELGSLGEQINKWAEATQKKADETPPAAPSAKPEDKS